MQESRSMGKDPGLEPSSGVYPRRCEVTGLERIAQQEDPEATVWTGLLVPTEQQGVCSVGAHRFRVCVLGEEVSRPSRFVFQNPLHT